MFRLNDILVSATTQRDGSYKKKRWLALYLPTLIRFQFLHRQMIRTLYSFVVLISSCQWEYCRITFQDSWTLRITTSVGKVHRQCWHCQGYNCTCSRLSLFHIFIEASHFLTLLYSKSHGVTVLSFWCWIDKRENWVRVLSAGSDQAYLNFNFPLRFWFYYCGVCRERDRIGGSKNPFLSSLCCSLFCWSVNFLNVSERKLYSVIMNLSFGARSSEELDELDIFSLFEAV